MTAAKEGKELAGQREGVKRESERLGKSGWKKEGGDER